ncbi:MAG: hypothetical protein WAM00_09875 [Salegentibacter sp.]
MKNILHKMKFFAVAMLVLSISSCDPLLDDSVTDFGTGPDFIGFKSSEVTAPFAVDGEDHVYNSTIKLFGPGLHDFTEDVTVTFQVDEANSSAEAGVNYSLASNSVTLTKENDYSAQIPITIVTEGIVPPVEKTITLEITDVSTSAPDVIISATGNKQEITVSYSCFADLSGTYTMTNSVCDPQVEGITIEANDEGGWYLSTADGGLLQYCTSNTGLQNDGNIIVVCGEVKPSNGFAFCGSNGIGCITGGTWDPETGTLTLEHNDTFFGVGAYTSTYVRTSSGQ